MNNAQKTGIWLRKVRELQRDHPNVSFANAAQRVALAEPELFADAEPDQEPGRSYHERLGPAFSYPYPAKASAKLGTLPNLVLVQCEAATQQFGASVPDEICYLPAGQHSIRPLINGKPGKVRLSINQDTARTLQEALSSRLGGRRPYGGFNHQPGAASFEPLGFRWDPNRGVMLRVNWSAAGKKAIAGKNYFGFSPTFLLGEDGQVGGLPESGEVGSLTNNPAFVGLDRIAGSHFSRLSARDIVIGALALQGFELQK